MKSTGFSGTHVPLSVIMFDIDLFSSASTILTDIAVGDMVLMMVAKHYEGAS